MSRVIGYTVFVAFLYFLAVITNPPMNPFFTNPKKIILFLQWMGKFALQLLVAKETWKHLSDRSQPKTFLSTYYIYTHTYLHFLNESF